MVFVKKWRFFNLLFLCKMDKKIVFFESSERKEAFLEQKNIGSKITKILHSFPWFFPKNGDFFIFSFYAKWMKKKSVFFEGSERKEAFLEQKNIGSKNLQNFEIFFKGLSPWFLSKNGDFLIFSFYAK